MKIEKISHKTLAETAAGKLAASMLDGSLAQGAQLPPERELMNQLGISRATLREALKALEENNLIESRPNVGWFARKIDESNIAQAKELARDGADGQASRSATTAPDTGFARETYPHPEPAKGPAGYV